MSERRLQDLTQLFAEELPFPRRTIESYAVNLRGAGLLAKSTSPRTDIGGGVVGARDATNFLLALLGSTTAVGAAAGAKAVGAFVFIQILRRNFTPDGYTDAPVALEPELATQFNVTFCTFVERAIEELRLGIALGEGARLISFSVANQSAVRMAWVDFVLPLPEAGSITGAAAWIDPEAVAGFAPSPTRFERISAVGADFLAKVAAFLGPARLEVAPSRKAPRGGSQARPIDGAPPPPEAA